MSWHQSGGRTLPVFFCLHDIFRLDPLSISNGIVFFPRIGRVSDVIERARLENLMITHSTYRKKPVEVEAMEVTESNKSIIAAWTQGQAFYSQESGVLLIETLEGDMRANVGDMVICGVNGEFYPCKRDIFDKTYDLVED